MPVPQDRRYLQSHEWHQLAGDTVTIGITQIAADELTDITYVKLPAVGAKISADSAFGEDRIGQGDQRSLQRRRRNGHGR